MNIKKNIHYQINSGAVACGASNPFDRSSIKKTGNILKVRCKKCYEYAKKEIKEKNIAKNKKIFIKNIKESGDSRE